MHVPAEMASIASFGHRGLQRFDRARVLGSHVDEPLAGTAGKPGQGKPFEDSRRISLHEQPVGERSRVPLVTVADNKAWAAGSFPRNGSPFQRGGEASPAAATQPGNLDLVQDSLRAPVFQHRWPGLPGGVTVEHPAEDNRRRSRMYGDLWGARRRTTGDLVGKVCTDPGFRAIQRGRPIEAVAQAVDLLK